MYLSIYLYISTFGIGGCMPHSNEIGGQIFKLTCVLLHSNPQEPKPPTTPILFVCKPSVLFSGTQAHHNAP